jgi:hypothetical protein
MKNDRIQNMKAGLAEYQEKLKSGAIEKPETMNPVEKAIANPKSLRAAVNAYCWECAGNIKPEVGRCNIKTCPLWNLRPWQRKTDDEGEDE